MNRRFVAPATCIRFDGTVPGDKSISHRALLLAALAEQCTVIEGTGLGGDVRSTMRCLSLLGVDFRQVGNNRLIVGGVGPQGLLRNHVELDCGNSGTTARLLCGLLAGLEGMRVVLTGDESLKRRPMARVVEPLRRMGAIIRYLEGEGRLPLQISGRRLRGAAHTLEVASAQVTSAILLAGLHAEGSTSVIQPMISRDHTQLMLQAFGASISRPDNRTTHLKPSPLELPLTLSIPGDFSSAAFWLLLGALHHDAHVHLRNINLNHTRTGFLRALQRCGATVSASAQTIDGLAETRGCLRAVSSNRLSGITLKGSDVPLMIDELPLMALIGAFASGHTAVVDAAELRVKESDRIAKLEEVSRAVGIEVTSAPTGFSITGPQQIRGGTASAYGDHRLAMWLACAGALSANGVWVDGWECCEVSYPAFFDQLEDASQVGG